MVAPRANAKKKKPNKKIYIAIAVFLFTFLIFFALIASQSGMVTNLQTANQSSKTELEDTKKQLQELKDRMELITINPPKDPNASQGAEMVNVVVAKSPLKAGVRITEKDLDTQSWPKDSVQGTEGYITSKLSLIGRVTSSDIASGEAVAENKLINKDTQTLDVPRGFRAMTIPITDITGVAGFITPGSRVDLLTVVNKTQESGATASSEKISRILIQNVKVLAVSGNSSASSSKKKDTAPSGMSSNITIAVPAKDVMKVALAYDNGSGNIQVVLRGFQDESKVDRTSADTNELIAGILRPNNTEKLAQIKLPKPSPKDDYVGAGAMDLNSILNNPESLPMPQAPTPQTKTHSIEIIQANTRQEVSFETEI